MLIMMNKRDPAAFDLYHVDLTTAELKLVEENTGNYSQWHCSGYVFDSHNIHAMCNLAAKNILY
jgi:hypothetical protein